MTPHDGWLGLCVEGIRCRQGKGSSYSTQHAGTSAQQPRTSAVLALLQSPVLESTPAVPGPPSILRRLHFGANSNKPLGIEGATAAYVQIHGQACAGLWTSWMLSTAPKASARLPYIQEAWPQAGPPDMPVRSWCFVHTSVADVLAVEPSPHGTGAPCLSMLASSLAGRNG